MEGASSGKHFKGGVVKVALIDTLEKCQSSNVVLPIYVPAEAFRKADEEWWGRNANSHQF